ncbi:unnamed protein product [Mesocestoides corti]|uniref:Uncharacterized protein n=1 Tax=Mesocestoides corti TaxID=53468 RepID=A0A0R3UAP8_MESCO|nr:unnamed protein product [Mesocestoides corti]
MHQWLLPSSSSAGLLLSATTSPRFFSFNAPSPSTASGSTNKSSSSPRRRHFDRQHVPGDGGDGHGGKSALGMAFFEAGEEVNAISQLVAFRRAKSCRRLNEKASEVERPLSELSSPPPPPSSDAPLPSTDDEPNRVRHPSLRRLWFH